MDIGTIIPANRVADISSHKPKPGEQAMLVTDSGTFEGEVQEDGSFVLTRRLIGNQEIKAG